MRIWTSLLLAAVLSPPLAGQSREWIVFGSMRSGDGDLWGVAPDGSIERVGGTAAPEGTLRFDPARNRIVHHRFDDEGAMLVSDGRDLFMDPNGDVAPQWGADGRIVYALEDEGEGDLWLAGPDGGTAVRLTRDRFVERYPSWSPDGDRVVFARRLPDGWDLFMIEVADGAETRLTRRGRYVGHPAWSPDGGRIAFDSYRDGAEQTDIAILDLATGVIDFVTDLPGNELIPAWSADGDRLAFGADTDGNWDIWLLDELDETPRRLTTDPAPDGGPIFVPSSALRPYR